MIFDQNVIESLFRILMIIDLFNISIIFKLCMHDYRDITLTNEFIKDTRPCILLQLSIDLNTENINIILGKISASSIVRCNYEIFLWIMQRACIVIQYLIASKDLRGLLGIPRLLLQTSR